MLMTRRFHLKKSDTAHFSYIVRKSIQFVQVAVRRKCSCMDVDGG